MFHSLRLHNRSRAKPCDKITHPSVQTGDRLHGAQNHLPFVGKKLPPRNQKIGSTKNRHDFVNQIKIQKTNETTCQLVKHFVKRLFNLKSLPFLALFFHPHPPPSKKNISPSIHRRSPPSSLNQMENHLSPISEGGQQGANHQPRSIHGTNGIFTVLHVPSKINQIFW